MPSDPGQCRSPGGYDSGETPQERLVELETTLEDRTLRFRTGGLVMHAQYPGAGGIGEPGRRADARHLQVQRHIVERAELAGSHRIDQCGNAFTQGPRRGKCRPTRKHA